MSSFPILPTSIPDLGQAGINPESSLYEIFVVMLQLRGSVRYFLSDENELEK